MTTTRQRLTDLDLAKGLAIFLVVLGHLAARQPPGGNDWFAYLTAGIYEFHMPFFMFLSGAVFNVTFKPAGAAAIAKYLRARAFRLMPGFVMFALVIWASKVLLGQVLRVDNAQTGSFDDLINIFTRPSESVASSLWYIHVLFQLYVLFALALALTAGRLLPVIAGAAVLFVTVHTTQVTTLFAANLVCEYALFFGLGAAFTKDYQRLSDVAKTSSLFFYSVFAASFVAVQYVPHPLSKAITGACSIPALFAFASSFRSERDRGILLLLGEYTFTIYLMNTLFIGFFKGAMLKIAPWDGPNFLIYLPVLLAAGILGPIAVHRLILVRIPLLARLTK